MAKTRSREDQEWKKFVRVKSAKMMPPSDDPGVAILFAPVTSPEMEKTVLIVANHKDRRKAMYTAKHSLGERNRLGS